MVQTIEGDRALVTGDNSGRSKWFNVSDLQVLSVGEPSSPPAEQPHTEAPAAEVGNSVPPPAEPVREQDSPAFTDHPFPLNGNAVPHTREAGSLNGRSHHGNTVPRPPEIERLEHLIRWQSELRQKDTLRDRWIYEEATADRTRYRMRWRKEGRLHSQELSQEEYEAMRDRIHYGQTLTLVNALIKLLVAELLPGHDEKATERRAAIERMIDTAQPLASIVAAIAGMTN